MIKTFGSLDCCQDKDCPLCYGTGYLIPSKEAIEKHTQGPKEEE